MEGLEAVRKRLDEHDDRIQRLSEKTAIIEVCYHNITETLNGISEEIRAIRAKLDKVFETNSIQDARIAEYRAMLHERGKSVSWLYGVISSVVTGVTVGIIIKIVG